MATPSPQPPDLDAQRTREPDLVTPSQANLNTSRRQTILPHSAPPRRPALGGGVTTNTSVMAAVSRHNDTIQEAARIRAAITNNIAKAIDDCIAKYSTPAEKKVAHGLQQRVIYASQRSWADVAATPENSSGENRDPRTGNNGARAQSKPKPAQARSQKEDLRIFITVPPRVRLQKFSPFAVRQAICHQIEALQLQDIPRASTINTGWAVTPANKAIRDRLLTQENKETMMRAVNGTEVRTPERWINYAIQGVDSSYRSVLGADIPTTAQLVAEEAFSQTGVMPVDCRTSRHGPTQNGQMTWIVSYREPVRAFRLFGTSDYSKEIRKNPPIQRHEDGCQGYCNPSRCTRAARCGNCGDRKEGHDGPIGAACPNGTKCANCHGPHPAGHIECPAIPRRVSGRLIKPTKKELIAMRKLGAQATRRVREAQAAPPAIGQEQEQGQERAQMDPPIARARPLNGPHRRQREEAEVSEINRAAQRPRRSVSGLTNLNAAVLSTNSVRRAHNHANPSSTSEREDEPMSEGHMSL